MKFDDSYSNKNYRQHHNHLLHNMTSETNNINRKIIDIFSASHVCK